MLPDKRINRHVLALNQNREMFNNPIVLSRLTEVENKIANNSLNVPIAMIPDNKLVELLGMVAKYTARDVGIKTGADEYEMSRFMDILKKYYKEFTVEEVKMAFELCVVGELDLYLPKDREMQPDKNHYQVFSVEYITKVLNAYKRKRNEVFSKAMKALPEPEHIITKEERDEIDISVRKQIRDKFVNYRDNGVRPVFYVHIAIFSVLRDIGLITGYDFETSKDSIEKALLGILQDKTVSERSKQEALKYKNSGTVAQILSNRAGLVEYDKKIIEIFDMIIADKKDIETLLSLE